MFILGHVVRVLYRNEETVPESFRGQVDLVKGDVTNAADVQTAVNGMDLVTVVLGTRNKLEPTKVLSTGMKNIIDAMKQANLRKFSVCLSSFLFFDPDKVPKQFEHLNAEHLDMLEQSKSSGLDYVAVLPPHIAVNEPAGEHKILHDRSPGRVISVYDLAAFLVDSLSMPEHSGKVCGLAKV